MNILVIIPCYNEAKNIENLIKTILNIGVDTDILIIDDNSPDGTANIVKKSFISNPHVNIIVRTKKDGRGSAILDGISWALARNKYQKVVEMDADFSHDPKEMPLLLEAARNADVVVGSRYLPKSKIINWPIARRIFSQLANFYAKTVLNIPMTDYTNGYRVYSISALSTLDRKLINCKGDMVLSAIAYQLFRKNFSFAEIPITFVNRVNGESKLNIAELLDAFIGILKIRRFSR